MKNFHFLLIFTVGLFLFSCDSKEPIPDDIEGTYYGSLSATDGDSKLFTQTENAIAEIRKTGDQEVEVHCYSSDFDTIFRLNYFHDQDLLKVCLTGHDFENMYHTTYSSPMGMGNMSGSEWENHLNQRHHEGDPHFGEFDPNKHSFEYIFLMRESSSSFNLHFKGYKKND